jgi:pyruvate carboxylase
LEHESFKHGKCDTTFIDKHPELFNLKLFDDREFKLLKFVAEKTISTDQCKPFSNREYRSRTQKKTREGQNRFWIKKVPLA